MTLVAAQQLEPQVAELSANEELSRAAIREAADAGAELIVLPELVTSGYVFRSSGEAASVAIDRDHPMLAAWVREAARGDAVVVAGFCERGDDGLLYNSAALLDGSGILAVYRKTHLWDREKLVFEPGSEAPPVLDTAAGRVGVLICYDLEFPEMTRSLALRGAEVLAIPTNWPLVDRPVGERPPEVNEAMAAARANRVFIACCDRVGEERGVRFTGGTTLIDEAGWPLAAVSAAGMAIARMDLTRARDKALGPRNDVFADRRPDLYRNLTSEEVDSRA